MNSQLQKNISYLKQFIGKEIIRTKPTSSNDWSFTETPIILEHITEDNIFYTYSENSNTPSSNRLYRLNANFIDENWILYEDVFKTDPKNPLSTCEGKNIRTSKTVTKFGESSSPVLIVASKHHIVVKETFLPPTVFCMTKDWEIV